MQNITKCTPYNIIDILAIKQPLFHYKVPMLSDCFLYAAWISNSLLETCLNKINKCSLLQICNLLFPGACKPSLIFFLWLSSPRALPAMIRSLLHLWEWLRITNNIFRWKGNAWPACPGSSLISWGPEHPPAIPLGREQVKHCPGGHRGLHTSLRQENTHPSCVLGWMENWGFFRRKKKTTTTTTTCC